MTSGLAHEIKNPLSTLGLNAQLLAEDIAESPLPDEQRDRVLRRLGALQREADRLRNILSDFLRYAGRIKLDPQPRDLGAIVEELADFLSAQCQQSGVLLRTDLPAHPIVATVDADLLKQALLNLMLNAIQAMVPPSAGGAPSSTSLERRGELILRVEGDAQEARIHVIDTGPGIAEEKLEEIFRPYVSSKPGGTGLGLPTARRIVEEHGGRLVAHSVVGRGSDFVVHLPVVGVPTNRHDGDHP
ncbi:MAG: HAMP domain-containing sensor histidine kinase [Phycisphaerales bacterium]